MTDVTLLNKNLSPNLNKPKPVLSKFSKFWTPKNKKILISVFSVLLIFITITATLGFFFVYLPAKNLMAQANQMKLQATELRTAVTDKDLVKAKTELSTIRTQLNKFESTYKKVSYAKIIPYVNSYYKDGSQIINIAKESIETGDILISAIEPYQDFLGLKGSAVDSAQTTEDRISFLTESVEGLIPHFDTIEKRVENIQKSLDQIDPDRYPDEFRGYKVKSTLLKAKELVTEAEKFLKDGKPILTKTSWLLGKDAPRNYLMIFQNDAELRPSGGFWTAYGTLIVNKGKITPGISDDIYSLDDRLNSTIPAPRIIKSYHINVPYLNLRDMNLYADFPTDAKIFLDNYNKITGNKQKIDAIIALDTQVLVDLVEVLGRIGVSGYGNFSADPDKRCDGCPQIIYQLEWMAGRPRDYIETDRKGFLGPLMHSLLSNAMGSEKSKMAPLAQAAFTNIYQKHILFYFSDKEMQKAAEIANIAGKITQTAENIDYIHLNDANFSSAKTNLFINQKIKHEIISQNGKVEHKITVTYTNPSRASNCNLEKGDLCLNAPKYRNMFRFYVPKGSQLIKMTGSEVEPVLYDESGKQVFEGFYGNKYPLYAQSSNRVSVQYTSPISPSSDYTLLLQKQPGTKAVEYQLFVNGKQQDTFDWVADKTIKLAL